MKKSQKKILAFRGDKGACWFYRLHSPLTYVAKNNPDVYDIAVSGQIDRSHYTGLDLVIFQRQYAQDVYDAAVRMKKNGIKLVYEIDDNLFDIPSWNPAYKTLGSPTVQKGLRAFLELVDVVFVTNNSMQKIYAPYCKKIYVLPNSINYDVIYPNTKNNQKKDVVCWQGSSTHERDVGIIKNCLKNLGKDSDIILKMWSGFTQREKIGSVRKPVFDIPGSETLQLVPFDSFFQMFAQVGTSIGLAPLTANKFNKCKSNLKFLEYTALDAVTVASSFGPYGDTIENRVTGILVSDNTQWYPAVRELLEDKDLYKSILKNAKEFVRSEYNIESNYKLWQTAIEEILTT